MPAVPTRRNYLALEGTCPGSPELTGIMSTLDTMDGAISAASPTELCAAACTTTIVRSATNPTRSVYCRAPFPPTKHAMATDDNSTYMAVGSARRGVVFSSRLSVDRSLNIIQAPIFDGFQGSAIHCSCCNFVTSVGSL